MKRIFTILALVMAVMPMMAQNARPTNKATQPKLKVPAPATSDKQGKTDKAIPFEGTITYEATAMPVVHQAQGGKENGVDAKQAPALVAAVPSAPIKDPAANEIQYLFIEGQCYCNILGTYFLLDNQMFRLQMASRRKNEHYRKATCNLDRIKNVDWGRIGEIIELQRQGRDRESQKMLNELYTRTGETSVVAGVKVVRYQMNGSNVKGDLWVAEDYVLKAWMFPFWGLQHPVLEFEFYYLQPELEHLHFHMKAKEMVPNMIDKEFVDRFETMERAEWEDVERTMIEQVLQSR